MVGDAANLPHHERLLSPFFRSRNVGFEFSNTVLEKRGTWTLGWYNDWWTQGINLKDSGTDVVARVTGLPLWQANGRNFIHVAASMRYVGADKGVLRFRGKPASNVSSDYVDTGDMAADHAWNYGFETLFNRGPLSLLAEYACSTVPSGSAGDPSFDGWYATGSWVVTGETRPYDRTAAYARRVLPRGRWGAVELAARYGHVDLDDAAVAGGTMKGWWAVVNWWATRRWKASVGYGSIDLDRSALTGNTRTLLTRIQWIH